MYMEQIKQYSKIVREITEIVSKRNIHIILAIIAGFVLGALSVVGLARVNMIDVAAKQYAYVDVERVINEVNNNLLEQIKSDQINDQEVTNKLTKAKAKFDKLLNSYTKEHHAIVISTNKVIAGAKDITEYFISNLKEIE